MSVQELLDFGMVKNDNPLFPFSKDLTLKKESDDDESEDKIELAIYCGNNQHDRVLLLPEGMVYLKVESIEDFRTIERMILGYEPKF